MRQYWYVLYKGEQVSPGLLKKELAVAWAREHYDLHKEQYSIQYVQFWDQKGDLI